MPLFLTCSGFEVALQPGREVVEIGASASHHGGELLKTGFTIGQVVHDYGNICQVITELAVELRA